LSGFFEGGGEIEGLAADIEPARAFPPSPDDDIAAAGDMSNTVRRKIGAVRKADLPFDNRDTIQTFAFAFVCQLEITELFRREVKSGMNPP
jgi:hypothetical protein